MAKDRRVRSVTKFLTISAFTIALSSSAMAGVIAAPPQTSDGGAPQAAAAPGDSTAPAKVTITPHRAIYDMSLTSVKNGSNITGVSGRMLFEWADVCDGWAVQQHLQLHFNYAEGDETDVTSTELTWESKDGKRYNFNVHRMSDGKETEYYRGKAVLAEDGSGTVIYSEPAGKKVSLPPGTVFPSTHTEMILQKAAAGEKLFSRRVFDGTDEDGSEDVSVFIHSADPHVQVADAKLKDNPLLAQPDYPVRMAFFKLDTDTGAPDYEMNLNLLANGVARRMQIDYGDFSVSGNLSNLEALPTPSCN